MARIRRYVSSWIDRRNGRAVVRYRFRHHGKDLLLPGVPGSPEFDQAYAAALNQDANANLIGAKRIRAGSIQHLVLAYFASAGFLALAPATRQTYRGILERFAKEHGSNPVALLQPKHIKAMLAPKAKTPAAANNWLRLVKMLTAFAVEEGFRKDDPASEIKRVSYRSDGFHSWTEEEIAQFEARHPVGSKARLALALGLYTAQRLSDVITLGRQHGISVLKLRQQKTGAPLEIPVLPELASIIKQSPVGDLHFLVTDYGKPFTAAGFGNWFRKQCRKAKLPKHCSFHGLRKAACTRLAEAGASANIIASISGHRTLKEVERYTKAADQKRLAAMGMDMLATKTVNVDGTVDKSRKKA